MNIRKLVVMCAAISMGATLAASNQQIVVQPSQGGGGVGGGVARRPIEPAALKGQPYSADVTNESVQTLGDGNKIVQRSTGRVYRDAEGRVRREDDRTPGTPSVSISDPVAGLSWTLDAANKTAREVPNMAAQLSALRERVNVVRPFSTEPTAAAGGVGRSAGGGGGVAGGVGRSAGGGGGRGGATGSAQGAAPSVPAGMVSRGGGAGGSGGVGGFGGGGAAGRVSGPSEERVVEDLPMKSIENLLCSGVRRTTTIAKGAIGNEQPIKIVSEEWTSVDLQVLVLTDLNDPRTGHSTYKLTSVRRGDPDPSLFKVPADYAVVRSGGRGGAK